MHSTVIYLDGKKVAQIVILSELHISLSINRVFVKEMGFILYRNPSSFIEVSGAVFNRLVRTWTD